MTLPFPDRRNRKPAGLFAVVAVVWVCAVSLGMCVFWAYGATPGESARGATAASSTTRPSVDRVAGRASVVMFVHPQCPCSRASLDALAELVACHAPGSIDATVVFADVADGETPVESSALWTRAASIVGVRRVRDVGGAIADRHGARTSGQTFCYAADGTLAFSGGLTAARGQAGESVGASALDAILDGAPAAAAATPGRAAPVFGCPLQ